MNDLINFRTVEPTEAAVLADYMDTVYFALAKLRGGELRLDGSRDEQTLADIYTGINHLSTRLLPRLTGIVEALIRAHYDAGGTHGELARAMDVESRSTAQTRGDKVRRTSPPSTWERWATGALEPVTAPAYDVRPGWTVIAEDTHLPVSEVRVYDTGRVEIEVAAADMELAHDAQDALRVVPRRGVPMSTTTGTHTWHDGSTVGVAIYRRA